MNSNNRHITITAAARFPVTDSCTIYIVETKLNTNDTKPCPSMLSSSSPSSSLSSSSSKFQIRIEKFLPAQHQATTGINGANKDEIIPKTDQIGYAAAVVGTKKTMLWRKNHEL